MSHRPLALAVLVVSVLLFAGAAPVTGDTTAIDGESDRSLTSEMDRSLISELDRSLSSDDRCSFPVTVTDGHGTEVTVDAEPEAIVVLGPSTAQFMWELDADQRVTGMPINQYTAYLDGHDEDRRNVVREDGTVDVERVVDLKPDLVLAPDVTDEATVEQLRNADLTVYHAGAAGSIDDVREQTLLYGELLGNCDEAEATVEWMDERLDAIEPIPESERPTVFYWMHGDFTAGAGTFQHELIELAGGENVGALIGIEGWAVANSEDIVEIDPQYLLIEDDVEVPESEAIQSTRAVQNDRIVRVDANEFNQPAPRVVLAVEAMAEQIEPVEDDARPVDSIPGFGVTAGMLGVLLTVALFVRNRR